MKNTGFCQLQVTKHWSKSQLTMGEGWFHPGGLPSHHRTNTDSHTITHTEPYTCNLELTIHLKAHMFFKRLCDETGVPKNPHKHKPNMQTLDSNQGFCGVMQTKTPLCGTKSWQRQRKTILQRQTPHKHKGIRLYHNKIQMGSKDRDFFISLQEDWGCHLSEPREHNMWWSALGNKCVWLGHPSCWMTQSQCYVCHHWKDNQLPDGWYLPRYTTSHNDRNNRE